MSVVASVTDWLSGYYPDFLDGRVKTASKKKTSKKEKSQETEEHPVVAWLIANLNKGVITLLDGGRVMFLLTKHECKCDLSVMDAYLNGKAYKKALKNAKPPVDVTKYAPHITTHKSIPNMLFCSLTLRVLNNDVDEVERHIKGRAYTNIFNLVDAEQQKLNAKRDEKRRLRLARRMGEEQAMTDGLEEGEEGDMFEGEEGDMFDLFGEGEGEEMFFEEDDEELEMEEIVDEEEEEEVIPPPKKSKNGKGQAVPVKEVSPVKPAPKQNKPKRK